MYFPPFWSKEFWHGVFWPPKDAAPPKPEPRHCCPFWECEYLLATPSDPMRYACPERDPPVSGSFVFQPGGLLKRTVVEEDYRQWEMHTSSGSHETHLTVICRRDQEWIQARRGPCVHVSVYHRELTVEHGWVEVCFGPVLMDFRQCDCLAVDSPGENYVGFNWGQAFVSATAISEWYAENVNSCECVASFAGGHGIGFRCVCHSECCRGVKKQLKVTIDCPDGPGPINPSPPPPTLPGPPGLGTLEFMVQWYPLDAIPAWATHPPLVTVPSWYGIHHLGGTCYLEFIFSCVLTSGASGDAGFLMILHGEEGDPCLAEFAAKFAVCGCGPGFFEHVFGQCSPLFIVEYDCGGTGLVRIEELP